VLRLETISQSVRGLLTIPFAGIDFRYEARRVKMRDQSFWILLWLIITEAPAAAEVPRDIQCSLRYVDIGKCSW